MRATSRKSPETQRARFRALPFSYTRSDGENRACAARARSSPISSV